MIVTLSMVREAASELMFLHDLTNWSFGFNDRKRCLGVCYTNRRRIEVSLDLVRSQMWGEILETIKHEIAHALVGPGHGHDEVWKAAAIRVGAKPISCLDTYIPESGVGAKYVAQCPCGSPHYLYRRTKNMTGRYCRRAGLKAGTLVYKPVRRSTNQE